MRTFYDDLNEARIQAGNAMDCLRKMADKLPEPWNWVARCGYVGCGGENHWKESTAETEVK